MLDMCTEMRAQQQASEAGAKGLASKSAADADSMLTHVWALV